MPIWKVEVRHEGLGKNRVFKGNDKYEVEGKAAEQARVWAREWLANMRTLEAKAATQALANLLSTTVSSDLKIPWEQLRKTDGYPTPRPKGFAGTAPLEPRADDPRFVPGSAAWEWLKYSSATARATAAARRFELHHEHWRREMAAMYAERDASVNWEIAKERFEEGQRRYNQWLDNQRADFELAQSQYENGESVWTALGLRYALSYDQLLNPVRVLKVDYHSTFTKDTGVLILDSQLPTLPDLPTLQEVKYVKASDSFHERHLSPREQSNLYNNFLHQIVLRTIYLVLKFDSRNLIKSVIYNGWIDFVEPSTGQGRRCFILSVNVTRKDFSAVDLIRADPAACFKAFKGIGAPNLDAAIPISPIARLDADDPRFVDARSVSGNIRQGTNLAAIGWEDFEHLIREIFEKEFQKTGGTVKVTRASRDGGVDVVAFDPDPIRGGKIVIQAKRYTNTVDVAAVRELYGTLVNEGATKGILVTTSSFGPDAYNFAKDKPIALIDGANLLHMLEAHGHPAYIDLAEAKRMNPTPLARSTMG